MVSRHQSGGFQRLSDPCGSVYHRSGPDGLVHLHTGPRRRAWDWVHLGRLSRGGTGRWE